MSKLRSSITALLGNKQAVVSQLLGFIDFDKEDDVVYVCLVRGNGFGIVTRELNFEDLPILEIQQGNIGGRVKKSPVASDAAPDEMKELAEYVNDKICLSIGRRLGIK